jgi:hypothetical protein
MDLRNYKTLFLPALLIALLTLSIDGQAQKERRRKASSSVVPASLRIAEAERSFTEGEKYFILEDYAKALY